MAKRSGVCSCSEGLILDDAGSRLVPGHDCGYVRARNACIPEAERRANAEVDVSLMGAWSAAFMRHMDAAARERGVVS